MNYGRRLVERRFNKVLLHLIIYNTVIYSEQTMVFMLGLVR